ncbi:uncharacterized protein M421DRAFT_189653 [Didymella exigua CBS 183.55]|uniref:Uncharacterized protein n=1 Tax=Didymella exigua CBS 183.55 TaxID=1150837 RepID=A0A6A5RII2_9PLEO|nr:uncharacterized protein M421DRAFT_189653 [Didymella exigua CBS 183.55]KAF1927050.1 hypothetical protein M421DRAFT_189653 [Didymella exigua CBS 183.55]
MMTGTMRKHIHGPQSNVLKYIVLHLHTLTQKPTHHHTCTLNTKILCQSSPYITASAVTLHLIIVDSCAYWAAPFYHGSLSPTISCTITMTCTAFASAATKTEHPDRYIHHRTASLGHHSWRSHSCRSDHHGLTSCPYTSKSQTRRRNLE